VHELEALNETPRDHALGVRVSVIIINHRHGDTVRMAVRSLLESTEAVPYEVLFVDNCPGDDAADWVRSNYPEIFFLRNPVPLGFAANVNRAVEQTHSEYIFLLNPDCLCLPGLIDGLVRYLDGNPSVGIAGPRLLNTDGSLQMSCRRFSRPAALLMRGARMDKLFASTRLLREYLMADFRHDGEADVDWITGAAMMVRRQAFDRIGGMDERYYLYSEDQDLCYRMWRNGWRVSYFPKARAVHRHLRCGILRPFSKAGMHQLRSTLLMFKKNGVHMSRVRPGYANVKTR